MPRRTDIKRILIIGSGPIVIGQACEFDYSGTQAVQGAARRGLRGRPGQLQSGDDHDRSGAGGRTYVEPLTPDEVSSAIIERSGRTRCCRRSADRPRSTWRSSSTSGRAREVRRRADRRDDRARSRAEDRQLFKEAMKRDRPRRARERRRARPPTRRGARSRTSASRRSSARRSRSAASAAASPTTSRSSRRSSAAASS